VRGTVLENEFTPVDWVSRELSSVESFLESLRGISTILSTLTWHGNRDPRKT
jgi:hypothetical protein